MPTLREEKPSITWLGPVCGMVAAVLYTMTNIALRDCITVDAYLVSAVKASPTVVVLGPLVGWMLARRETLTRPRARLKQFIAASFTAQFFGNAAFQKALEYIGLAASVPITLGVLIVGGAALGAILLGEPVGRQKIIAMILLISAVLVLSLPRSVEDGVETGLENGAESSVASIGAAGVLLGSMWAAVSGLAFSFFGVTLRQNLQSGMRASTLMFISGLIGTITLWAYSFYTLGGDGLGAIKSTQWNVMIVAGVCNFSAFVALTTSLRLLPVVAVNLINASQVAMAAIAGVLLFKEDITLQLMGGILLTLAGLIVLARRTRAPIVITD